MGNIMSTFGEFWDEFQARFSRAPVWLPGTSMSVGDIGIIDHRGYLRVAKLADFDIDFEEQPSDAKSEYFVWSQHAKVKEIQGTGAALDPTGIVGQVEASMHMSFAAARSFVVRAAHVQGRQIPDVRKVESEISRRQAINPFWQKEWIYIQEVITAQPCIMVVSEASGAEAAVKATGSGPGLSGFAQLFEAGTSLQLSGEASNVQQIVTRDRAPLMWRGRWLRGLIRKNWTSRGRGAKEGARPDLYEDFDDPTLFEQE
jgi:hypothetical protein